MEAAILTLVSTPWWVFAIFFYSLYLGVKNLKTQKIPVWKLVVFPAIFTVWSIITKWVLPDFTAKHMVLWIIAAALGVSMGWFSYKYQKIEANKDGGHLKLEGSFTTLALILSIFSVKYYFGYVYETSNSTTLLELVFLCDLVFSAFVAGLFTGRSCNLFSKYRRLKLREA